VNDLVGFEEHYVFAGVDPCRQSGDVIEKLVDANNDVKVQGKKGEHFVLLGVKCGDTALAKKPG